MIPAPMSYHSFYTTSGDLTSHAKRFEFPADIQPKLDGIRCLAGWAEGEIRLWSRNGKPFDLPHIVQALHWLPRSMVLDGELFVPGEPLQTITSLVKRQQEGTERVEFHVFDVPGFAPWSSRKESVRAVRFGGLIRIVSTAPVLSSSDVADAHARYVAEGHEGAVLRALDAPYAFGARSPHVLKVKAFSDAEFPVIGAEEGQGKDAGTPVFVCRDGEGEFRACMTGPLESRRRMWEERGDYIGRELTVRFFGRMAGGLPRFPKGVGFRDD